MRGLVKRQKKLSEEVTEGMERSSDEATLAQVERLRERERERVESEMLKVGERSSQSLE
jgi:hypothetical protein